MLNDVVECFVKGRKNKLLPLYYFLIVLACILAIVLLTSFFAFIGTVFGILFAGFGAYLIYFISRLNKIEYEYSVSCGDFSVSEIRNQTKRKALFTCGIRDIKTFEKLFKEDLDKKSIVQKGDARLCLCFGDNDEIIYHFTVRGEDGIDYDIYIANASQIIDKMAEINFEIRRATGKF